MESIYTPINIYYRVKKEFFKKHHYSGGDKVFNTPVFIVKGNIYAPAEIHTPLKASISQLDYLYAFLVARELYCYPPLKIRVVAGEYRVVEPVFDPAEALTLLEDIPSMPRLGVVQSIYSPPIERLDASSNTVLLTTATILDTETDTKYPAILYLIDTRNILAEIYTWIKQNRGRIIDLLVKDKKEALAGSPLRTGKGKEVKKAVSNLRGNTINYLELSDDPPLALVVVAV